MLIGCCHCDEKKERPSSSEVSSEGPPSDNSGSDVSSSEDSLGLYIPCNFCLSGIYPKRVRLDIPAFGTSGVTSCGDYTGSFVIPNTGGGSTAYLSTEPALNINTGLPTTMTSGPNPASRFIISYACGQNVNSAADVTVEIRWSTVSSSTPGGLSKVHYDLFVPFGTLSINCLLPITLTRRAFGPFNAGPCGVSFNSSWPSTITLTPV